MRGHDYNYCYVTFMAAVVFLLVHTTQAKKNKQGKLEHIENNGFISKKWIKIKILKRKKKSGSRLGSTS